jgi:hypothetical protein
VIQAQGVPELVGECADSFGAVPINGDAVRVAESKVKTAFIRRTLRPNCDDALRGVREILCRNPGISLRIEARRYILHL